MKKKENRKHNCQLCGHFMKLDHEEQLAGDGSRRILFFKCRCGGKEGVYINQ